MCVTVRSLERTLKRSPTASSEERVRKKLWLFFFFFFWPQHLFEHLPISGPGNTGVKNRVKGLHEGRGGSAWVAAVSRAEWALKCRAYRC